MYQNAQFSYNIVFLKLSVKNCEVMWKSVAFFKITIVKMSLTIIFFRNETQHVLQFDLRMYATLLNRNNIFWISPT